MVYFLFGPDTYSIRERVRELIDGKTIRHVTTKEDTDALIVQGLQEGLFGEPPVIIIQELFQTLTVDWLQRQTVDIVILSENSPDKRTSLYKWLIKQSAEEFLPKERGHVFTWAKNKGYTIEPSVLQLLWDRHQSNLWFWHQELEKLQAFAGFGNPITQAHTSVLIGKTVEDNVFIFLDEFGNRNPKAAALYMQLLEYGADEYYVFSMLARQIRLLLLAYEPNGLQGQHPYVAKKLQAQVKKWESSELVNAHTTLLEIDTASKTGFADIEDELPAFVLQYSKNLQ